MILAGIDYSMTSPAICIFDAKEQYAKTSRPLTFDACRFFFLSDKKKYQKTFGNIHGAALPVDYESQEERFDHISGWAVSVLQEHRVSRVAIEDYAFAATGRVFHIAENAGLLKYKWWKRMNDPMVRFTPNEIKKHLSGKGNASKRGMELAFEAQTGVKIKEILGQNENHENPSSDLIDSYAIVGLLHHSFENGSRK